MPCEVKKEDLLSLFPLLCSVCDSLMAIDRLISEYENLVYQRS